MDDEQEKDLGQFDDSVIIFNPPFITWAHAEERLARGMPIEYIGSPGDPTMIKDSRSQVPKRPVPQKADIDKILSLNFTLEEIKALHEKYKGFGWFNDKYVIGFPIERRNSSFYDCVLLRTPDNMMIIHFFNDELKVEKFDEVQTIAFFERAFNTSLDMEQRFSCFPD